MADLDDIYSRKASQIERRVIETFHRIFVTADNSDGRMHIFPNIPAEVMAGVTSTFLNLEDDELLIAVFDETLIMRHAKQGFAFTTKRVCWQKLGENKESFEYSKITGPVKIEGVLTDEIRIGQQAKINIALNKNKRNEILQFVQHASELYKNSSIDDKISNEESIWHISISGNQSGPYSINTIKKVISSSEVELSKSFVWKQGMPEWRKFLDVPELATLLQDDARALKNPSSKIQNSSPPSKFNSFGESQRSALRDLVANDDVMEKVFSTLYRLIERAPVVGVMTVVVKEEAFVAFCMKNKEHIFKEVISEEAGDKTELAKPPRLPPEEPVEKNKLSIEQEGVEAVDLNKGDVEKLLLLPGIQLSDARKLIEERARRRGFETFEEIGEILNLQPHQLEKLKVIASLGRYESSGAFSTAGRRVIDF
jgi:hypothetical protein